MDILINVIRFCFQSRREVLISFVDLLNISPNKLLFTKNRKRLVNLNSTDDGRGWREGETGRLCSLSGRLNECLFRSTTTQLAVARVYVYFTLPIELRTVV